MSIKGILVHLDPASDNRIETEAAIQLAETHGAHLRALATATSAEAPFSGFAGLSSTILTALENQVAEEIARVRAAYEKACAKHHFSTDFDAVRIYDAEAPEVIAGAGRRTDLLVMRQTEPGVRRTGGGGIIESVIMGAGRPVLTVPYATNIEAIGKNVLIGWDGSREAARALQDAMPLMQRADQVHVLVVDAKYRRESHSELPGAEISAHLARHGLRVELTAEHADGIDPANLILSRAADLGADLLVMGAFGHSRLQETLFGGFTKTILKAMTLPVLLSH